MRTVNGHLMPICSLIVAIICYLAIIGPFSSYMQAKPIEEKLGFVPSSNVVGPMSGGFKELTSAGLVLKVIMYFGGLFTENEKLVQVPPDYDGMSRLLHSAVALDPYNMDAYYFAQSFLVWDMQKIQDANRLLDYGMEHRPWDWYLPFFAGFNHAYFLKEYDKAAKYYMRAAEITGESLFARLAGRYMQEAGETRLAILYLEGMLATARGELEKQSYATRLKAFEGVLAIEAARDKYLEANSKLPASVEELVDSGFLPQAPEDPYGGRFVIAGNGKVTSTSKFAFGPSSRQVN